MLYNALEKHHSSPGFTLLLGYILQYTNFKPLLFFFPFGLVASLYLVRQQGEGHILDDMGVSGIRQANAVMGGTLEFLFYFIEFLENPERSGTHSFDQHRYATAAKECLQLYLCNHHKFSKETTESARRDKVLLRNKPWAWRVRLGTHKRISKAIQYASFPQNSSEYKYHRSLAYEWALDLLPTFLEESAISLELADVLRDCIFTTMAQQFRRKMMLARKAITSYLFRVDSAVGRP